MYQPTSFMPKILAQRRSKWLGQTTEKRLHLAYHPRHREAWTLINTTAERLRGCFEATVGDRPEPSSDQHGKDVPRPAENSSTVLPAAAPSQGGVRPCSVPENKPGLEAASAAASGRVLRDRGSVNVACTPVARHPDFGTPDTGCRQFILV